jgi:hypothetical protein
MVESEMKMALLELEEEEVKEAQLYVDMLLKALH